MEKLWKMLYHLVCKEHSLFSSVACMLIPNRSNVTFYMEDDSGTPLSADEIIPLLSSEATLAPNPGNPYFLVQVDKGMKLFEKTTFEN